MVMQLGALRVVLSETRSEHSSAYWSANLMATLMDSQLVRLLDTPASILFYLHHYSQTNNISQHHNDASLLDSQSKVW